MIDYTKLKAAMTTAGYVMSDGDAWTTKDESQYRSYCYLHHNRMVPDHDLMALAYEGIAPVGFPGGIRDPNLELEDIEITGDTDVEALDSIQLTATGTFEDESTYDITSEVTWASDDDQVATVVGGLVTGVSGGAADITATMGLIDSDPFEVTVTDPIVSVEITGDDAAVAEATVELTASATTKGGDLQDVTTTATWTSSNELVATVADGVVDCLSDGVVTISAEVDSVIGEHEITVSAI